MSNTTQLIPFDKQPILQRWKMVFSIAWPLIIANSFWNLQLTVDRIFLGQYSTEALGAAMAVMGVFWVPMALLQQTAHYVTTFVAQYFGAQQHEKIGAALWQAMYVSIIGGILFLGLNSVSALFFSYVGHSPIIQDLEVTYFNALAFSALPTALIAAISGFFTGLGRTKMVIGINLSGLCFNILFDYILIPGNFGFAAYGIAGAGYATALSAYCAAGVGLLLLCRKHTRSLYQIWESKNIQWTLMAQFLKFGVPSGMQWALEGLAFTVFLMLMGHFHNGDVALASSSIAVTVMLLAILPSMGVAQAVMTLVGQKLGEKKSKEAELLTWDGVMISAVYISIVGISFCVFPEFYLSWFSNEANPTLWHDVQLLTPTLLAIAAIFTLFDSIYLNVSFALKGAGDTRYVSLVALTIPWPFLVLPTYMLRHHPDATVLSWLSVIGYSLVLSTVLILRFKKGSWKSMSVIE